jgi:hypothetical protein
LHHTQVLCQYRLYRVDHAYLTYLMLPRQLSYLKGRKLDHRQVKPLIFSVSGFILFYTANMFILMILYDFCLSPAQFCYIVSQLIKLLLITPRHRPHRKHRFRQFYFCVTHLSHVPRTEHRCPFHWCMLGICWLAKSVVYRVVT